MVYSEEVNELLIVSYILVSYFNSCLQVKDIIFLARFALKYAFKGFLALCEFFKLLLIRTFLGFSARLLLDHLLSSK